MSVDPELLSNLSTKPGVYLFRDAAGDVLYVGKAKALRPRVRSYFRRDPSHSAKTRELMRQVDSVQTLVVASEAEALILEANLIKSHKPRFNILLRDDKRFPYIKVTMQEPFPRVYVTRRVLNDGARYFGPFTKVGAMRQALDLVKRLHTVRSCRYNLPVEAPARPCLDYHIGRCKAPCVGLQSQAEYGAMISEIVRILEGDTEEVRRDAEREMREASAGLDFERAARLRDVIQGLDTMSREQRVQRAAGGSFDVVGLARDGAMAAGVVMRIRSGLLLGRESVRFTDILEESDRDLLTSLLARYYLGGGKARSDDLPKEVLIPGTVDDQELFSEVLSEAAGSKVTLHEPQRGTKRRLVDLGAENARQVLEDRVTTMAYANDRAEDALYSLQDALNLKVLPRFMACFDVSHNQGTEVVASVVTFENGEPRKAGYRHMRIKGEWGNDDYRSMAEAVMRYTRRRVDEEKPLPDLIVIDGGKGQLSAAAEALRSIGLHHVAVLSLAKRDEEVFLPGCPDPVRLDRRDRSLHLLQRIRDEAHRFAVQYNRKLRGKRTIRSELGDIPGVGPRRQTELLRRFGSVKGVRSASPEEIARLPGFSDVLATRILTYLGSGGR